MIQLLYSVILAEMALILALLFKTPLRKLVIMALDRVKRGRGPVMVKTVSGTVFVVLCSSLYSMVTIQNRSIEAGAPNPTDQVLESTHLLEASLMGKTVCAKSDHNLFLFYRTSQFRFLEDDFCGLFTWVSS